MDALDYIDLFS